MEEEKKEPEKEQPKEPAKAEPKPVDMVTKANEAAERLEKANTELKQLLDQQAKIKAEVILGGRADAGQRKRMTKDDKAIANARKLLKGTGYDDVLFPVKE